MEIPKLEEIRKSVRMRYGEIAKSPGAGCGCLPSAPCCGQQNAPLDNLTELIGYSKEEIESAPEGAHMGLGCGNPQAIARLSPGETVLDLGSGGGFDCFLAARKVGESGRVIGVDMTPEMVSQARKNAEKAGSENVDFRLGEIEHLPVGDTSVDVIISNCVINLSPEKEAVFREAFRVLKPGGRLAISDIVATADLPDEIRNDLTLVSACVGGAETIDSLERTLADTGFTDIKIQPRMESRDLIQKFAPGRNIEDYLVSASIEAVKPEA